MRDGAAYADQLRRLLPQGRAWLSAPGSLLTQLLDALAQEFARVDGRAMRLNDEADPLSALEMLPDWERVAGLPDQCLPVGGTITERQRRVARKVSGIGGQSRGYFIEIAAQLGLAIAIEEFRPFAVGSRSGDACYGVGWRFVFRVRLLPQTEISGPQISSERLHAGSRSGDRLRSFSVSELECMIRRAAPAHAKVLFAYPVEPEPILWHDFI